MIKPVDENQQVNSWLATAAVTFGGVYLVNGIVGVAFGFSFVFKMDPLLAIILLPLTAMAVVCSVVGLMTGVSSRDLGLLIFTVGPFLPLAYLCFVIYSLFIRPMVT